MSVTAKGARPYPDKWPRESATPLVERYHSAVRALAAEKFEASGLSWEEAVEQGALLPTREELQQIEADVLAEGYKFDVSATISMKEEPDKYKPLAGIADSGEQESDEQGRKIVGAGDNVFKAPADIANQLEYQVHDFFTRQPVQADLYVLRIVLHVFGNDEKAAAILKNILPA